MSSPANVELAALDAFWASEMPEHDAFFEDLAMPLKPLDLAAAGADEDAWLFGDKTSFAVRDIRVTSDAAKPATLTIDVQQTHLHSHDDEDATSVLLEPIMGSPVDELDAMAAFMVDDVDPFQEVVVTSDDEPTSPVPASAKASGASRNARAYCSLTEEKKLEKLRATVAHLEKMYYARCHGRAASLASDSSPRDSDLNIQRVKMVRSIERLQRIACDVAQENYGFRAGKMPQRAREELFLHEMAGVLKSPMAREQLCGAIADKLCSDAIVATARRSAEAAMGLSAVAGESLLGWDCRKTTESTSGVLTHTAKKEFLDKPESDFARVTTAAWQTLLASEQFAAFMKHGAGVRTTRSHVLKRLSEDAILIAFDTVEARDAGAAVAVVRDVCVAFRVRTTTGVMVGVSSVAPSLFEPHVHALQGVSYVDAGMRWMQFSQKSATGFSVTAGSRVQCESRAAADAAHVAALATVMQWERAHLAAALLL